MAARIHSPVRAKRDQTGLVLFGRNRDGRYQYQSKPVIGATWNIVNLTHAERVGLAVARTLLAAEWGPYEVYPMTREQGNLGYGVLGTKRQWITRPQFGDIGRAFLKGMPSLDAYKRGLFSTVIHECGHNFQRPGTRPHGVEFKREEIRAQIKIEARLRRGWPKLDMRKLRDSKIPA